MKELYPYKTYGPDGIARVVSKECIDTSDVPLVMSRISLNEGSVPAEWRRANVVPILKKCDSETALNDRPESRTSTVCEIREEDF